MIWVAGYIGVGLIVVLWRNLAPDIWPLEVAFHLILWPLAALFWLTGLIEAGVERFYD